MEDTELDKAEFVSINTKDSFYSLRQLANAQVDAFISRSFVYQNLCFF